MINKRSDHPKVGIGILVFKNGKVLLGKRKGAHGAGYFGSLGGHLEYMESFEECAKREAKEEAGIDIKIIKFLCLTNFKVHKPKHYVDIGLMAKLKSGTPKVLEPSKCEGWKWYDLDNLPTPLFSVVKNYLIAYKTGKNYFDS